ncbi:MAG: fibronectin type III domain-containing protein [Salinispira sp.]
MRVRLCRVGIFFVFCSIFITLFVGCPVLELDTPGFDTREPNAPGSDPVVDATSPGKMDAPTLERGHMKLVVNWDAPAGNGSSAIAGYELQYREVTSTEGSWEDADVTTTISDIAATAKSHIITELADNTSYDVRVRAQNAAGYSDWSESATETTAAIPSTPGAPTISSEHLKLIVNWTAPAGNGGLGITGYELEYRVSATTLTVNDWQTATLTDTSYRIMGLKDGTTLVNDTAYNVDVRVRAQNAAGDGNWSPTTTGSETLADIVPLAPTNLMLQTGDQLITATWTVPVDNGGSAVTSHTVQYSPDANFLSILNTTFIFAPGTSTYTTGLINGTTYYVRVFATNMKGNSVFSETVTAIPADIVPNKSPAPTISKAGAGVLNVAITAPTSNGGSAISAYNIRYISGGITTSPSDDYDPNSDSIILTVTAGAEYVVQVRAVNSAGPGPWSELSNAITP